MMISKLILPVITLVIGISAGAWANQTPCVPGTYQDETGKYECKPCPRGYYCPNSKMTNGKAYPCPKGKWCPDDGLAQPQPCPAGAYCPGEGELSIEAVECPAGTYILNAGSWFNKDQCKKCEAGYYCPNPKERKLCDLGYYCTGGDNEPQECSPGTYCGSEGKEDGGYSAENPCPAGYYCPTPIEKIICPAGHFCPQGSVSPTICTAGTYQYNTGRSSCITCSVGTFCPEGSDNRQKVTADKCSQNGGKWCDCPAGYHCPTPADLIQCDKGYYCPGGSSAAQKCPDGKTTLFKGSKTQKACFVPDIF